MENNKKYSYGRYMVLGIAGVAAATTLALGATNRVSAKTNFENNGTYDTVVPSAGIAVLLNSTENEENPDNKQDIDFTGGIASVISSYCGTYEQEQKVSIEAVDKVLKLLPAEREAEPSEISQIQEAGDIVEEPKEPAPVTSVIPEYTVLGVANVTNYLNVRETPDIEGKLLGKLPMNAGCEVLETHDGWYKIQSGNVEGFVSAEFLLTGEEANQRAREAIATVARVNADKLMVREQPNTDCTIITKVAEGEELEVVEQLDGWIKINIDNETGYVCADYVSIYQTLPKGVTLKELSSGDGVNSTAIDLIEYAKQFLGNPYVYGGTSLTNGTDCSGFTMRVFEHFGYSLSRTSREQAYNGTRVSLSEIKPGDLLFYNHGSSIGHVAIYIGNGQIIHASTERTGIIIGNAYYTTPVCATRIIN